MASIKGVSLKGLKMGIGHDGAGFQANIYLHNKKIGEVLDNNYGPCLDIDIFKDKEEFQNACLMFKEQVNEFSCPQENLLRHLLELKQDEDEFKKALKKSYKATILLDFKPRDEEGNVDYAKPFPYPLEKTYWLASVEDSKKIIDKEKPIRYKIYQSLEDFIA